MFWNLFSGGSHVVPSHSLMLMYRHDIDDFYAAMEIAQHIPRSRKHLLTGSLHVDISFAVI